MKFVPEWTGKEGQVKEAFDYYDKLVYPGQKVLGAIDPERVAKLQDFYFAKGIIQKKSPVDELYTNQFVAVSGFFFCSCRYPASHPSKCRR